ncbi:hypothetical protein KP509_31G052900, partial [Ceratopteris richardii]
MIITRFYQPLAWAKWCRRLPRITETMRRMRDLYMEITFNFESSVIPFISRIAPSDTYRIWKRGSNLRADMTLAGFNGFKLQRADQSFLFLGDGTEDGKVPPGSLLVLTHKDKEITNALEGAGAQPSEAEIAQEVAAMSQTNMYRPGIDVTQAELIPQLTWRRQEKTEMVGSWKAKIYEMHHVHISVRSRRVPGALTDEEFFAAETDAQADVEDDYSELLTEEEKQQLEDALTMDALDPLEYDEEKPCTISPVHEQNTSMEAAQGARKDQGKSWFGWGKRGGKEEGSERKRTGSFFKSSGARGVEGPDSTSETNDASFDETSSRKSKDATAKRVSVLKNKQNQNPSSNGNAESEYRKGLRPVLWLTPDFPLKTEELLPLLDILANKVKVVRRLRELLTTKLPLGTFPVKVAIPIVPTIRVVVTFNKFEEVSMSKEFGTPLSSPTHFSEAKGKELEASHSSSWLSWTRGSKDQNASTSSVQQDYVEDMDPFVIPSDYTWIDMKEKKRRLKARKSKTRSRK